MSTPAIILLLDMVGSVLIQISTVCGRAIVGWHLSPKRTSLRDKLCV